jgi:catechol 2,3-dioxygenase-like lactoylglutathione lyase family enzyme
MKPPTLNHIILTVVDPSRTKSFYTNILDFDIVEEENSFYFMAGDTAVMFYASRQPQSGDRFSEFRVGLDHLSFTSESQEALDAMAARLKDAGVETNGVEVFKATGNYYIAFRDPDNIQLEFWLP